jgi:hypothetical protein
MCMARSGGRTNILVLRLAVCNDSRPIFFTTRFVRSGRTDGFELAQGTTVPGATRASAKVRFLALLADSQDRPLKPA